MIRRERMAIQFDLIEYTEQQQGLVTIAPTTRIPRRVIFTATAVNTSHEAFGIMADVLLVPISFKMEPPELYRSVFSGRCNHLGPVALRDNVILLLRIATHGVPYTYGADRCDIPESLRNRTDYQLVVTCPVIACATSTDLVVFLLLEMEF
ncbi:hypothetical protein BC827DRAFT_1250459 [Russula dissimulans]|nr:hypothetical protein BC827DRAFT_1250459 [Russula dissimulans]